MYTLWRYLFLVLLPFVIASCGSLSKTDQPRVQQFDGGKHWVLTKSMKYSVRNGEIQGEVPKGFVTDFASVPRPLWSLVARHGKHSSAAIVHDYLYWTQPFSRKHVDNLMNEMMEEAAVWPPRRVAIYQAVDAAGEKAWRENAKAREAGKPRIVPEELIDSIPPQVTWPQYQRFLIGRERMVRRSDLERRTGSEEKLRPPR